MFIQVIQGKLRDEAGLTACMQRWETDLMPGAVGYLGTTAGLCDDGTYIALVRFESAEAARQNSARPEQASWWAEMSACFDGEVSFQDCDEVRQWLGGGSDDAGFVQIMAGHSADVSRMYDLMSSMEDKVHDARPEIIGGMLASTADGGFVEAIYFTSEDAARSGENAQIPDDVRAALEEETALMGEVEYHDLHQPMLVSVRR
jgi:hypothetical protein